MLNIDEMIKEEFLEKNNKKIANEDINKYLSSLKKEELIRLASMQIHVDNDYDNLSKVYNLNNKVKKDGIEYIINNLDKILICYIKIMKREELAQLEIIMDNNCKKIYLYKTPISIHFVHFVKMFSLAKVEYNSKEESLKFFMPDEFINIFKVCLNNKELLKINEYNNVVYNYVESVVDTYGVVTLDKMHEIFESQMFKIDIDELIHIIDFKSLVEGLNVYSYYDLKLLCNIQFDEDEALSFYNEQEMNYRMFSKKEFMRISDGTYVENLKSYKKFVNYLCNNFIGIERDIDYIKEVIVNDYIFSAQLSVEKADSNFKYKMMNMLEADYELVDKLLSMMKNIYKEYPKWIKRGNC